MNRVYFLKTDTSNPSDVVWKLLKSVVNPMPQVERTKHGKPYFPNQTDIQFSLSHTTEAVVCAISDRPCGVDIESVHRPVNQRVCTRFFTKKEIACAVDPVHFLEVWTRKEALIKRYGKMTQPLCQMETLANPQIQTKYHKDFLISFCSEDPSFTIYDRTCDDLL